MDFDVSKLHQDCFIIRGGHIAKHRIKAIMVKYLGDKLIYSYGLETGGDITGTYIEYHSEDKVFLSKEDIIKNL